MAQSYASTDPNFGLDTSYASTDPNFGLEKKKRDSAQAQSDFETGLQKAGVDTQAPEDSYYALPKETRDSYDAMVQKAGDVAQKPLISRGVAETINEYPNPGNPFFQLNAIKHALSYVAPDSTATKTAEGLSDTATDLTQGQSSPMNLALMAGLGSGKLAQVLIGSAFEAQAIKALPDQWRQYQDTTNPQERAHLLSSITLGLGLPLAAPFHAAQAQEIKATLSPDAVPQTEPQPATVPEQAKVPEKPDLTPQRGSIEQPRGALQSVPETESAQTPILPVSQEPIHAGVEPDASAPQVIPPEGREVPQPMIEGPHVVSTAIRDPQGNLLTGNRWNEPHDGIAALHEVEPQPEQKGFLVQDENGNQTFATREEAAPIARDAGQVVKESQDVTSLRSEDLRRIATVKFTDEPQAAKPTAAPQGGGDPIGVAAVHAEAEQPGSVIPGEGQTWEDSLAQGRDYINKGGDPRLAIRRAQSTGLVGAKEVGIVRAEYERLAALKRQAIEQFGENDPRTVAAEEAQRSWRKELQPVLTKASDALRAAQNKEVADVSTFSGLHDLITETYGGDRALTPKERTQLQKAAKGVSEVQKQARESASKAADKVIRETRATKLLSLEDLKADLADALKDQFKDCLL